MVVNLKMLRISNMLNGSYVGRMSVFEIKRIIFRNIRQEEQRKKIFSINLFSKMF